MTPQDLSTTETGSTDGVGHEYSEALTLNERFEILKNERRRYVLEHLLGTEGAIELGTLADHIAAVENDTAVDAVTSSERKRVYVALYQFHLPKMDRMDVVDYDKDRGTVSLTLDGRRLYQEHEADQRQRRSPDILDLCACALGAVVLISVVLTQAWFVGSMFLGVQTVLLGSRVLLSRLS